MSGTLAHWKRNVKSALIQSQAVQQLLSRSHLEDRCRQAGQQWRRSFWSPPLTVMTFLMQILNPAKTLRAAVAEALAQFQTHHPETDPPSSDPSAFSQARQRIPEAALRTLLDDTTRQMRAISGGGTDRCWCGLEVKIIDGSSVSMPDTPALQQAFPQPPGQSSGCGFPVASMVTIFEWASGALLDWRLGSHHHSEMSMFRSLLDHFGPGTVALADRYYCSYVDVARLMERGAHVVFRLHQRRSHDFRQGQPLGPDDRLVTWPRPRKWLESFGLSQAQFEALPEQITLRMIRTTRAPKGFRSRTIVIITTILDPTEASADQLLALYRDRWLAELNLRSLKTTLDMRVLRGKSVAMVRKELLMHLLLYNLIRLLMWEAATLRGVNPRRLSFAGTLHRLQSALPAWLMRPHDGEDSQEIFNWLLACIAADLLPHRPDRFEPRRIKRRPKQYSHLTKPRSHYRRHGDDSCR